MDNRKQGEMRGWRTVRDGMLARTELANAKLPLSVPLPSPAFLLSFSPRFFVQGVDSAQNPPPPSAFKSRHDDDASL